MTNTERIQAHNAELREAIELAEKLPEAGGVAEPVIDPLEITENGTYTAPDGVDGYSPVTVNVPIPEGYIQPSGELEVTENGAHDVMAYASVNVNVPSGGVDIDKLIDRTITEVSGAHETIGKYIFYGCSELTTVDFPNVTSIGQSAFENCYKLTTVDFPNVTSIGQSAFENCYKLTTADFPNVTSIDVYAFQNCSKLTIADFPNVTSISTYAFSKCSGLITVNVPNATYISDYTFNSCTKLTSVVFPNVESIGDYSFAGCSLLTSVDFPKLTSFGTFTFRFGYSLKTVILRSDTVCTMPNTNVFSNCYHFKGTTNSTYNPTGAKDGYIYVPAALVDSYKSATNWSVYASQIRAIEDYPDICGG